MKNVSKVEIDDIDAGRIGESVKRLLRRCFFITDKFDYLVNDVLIDYAVWSPAKALVRSPRWNADAHLRFAR